MKRRLGAIAAFMSALLGLASCTDDAIPMSVDWQDAMGHLKQLSPAFQENRESSRISEELVERWVYPEVRYAFLGWADDGIEKNVDEQLHSISTLSGIDFVRVESFGEDRDGTIAIILTQDMRTVIDQYEEALFGKTQGQYNGNASLWADVINRRYEKTTGNGAPQERRCVTVKSSGPYEGGMADMAPDRSFVLKSFGIVAVYEGRKQHVVGCVMRSIFSSFGFVGNKLTRRSILVGRPMTYLSRYDKAALHLFYADHFPRLLTTGTFVQTVERLEDSYLKNARIELPETEGAFDVRLPWWEVIPSRSSSR